MRQHVCWLLVCALLLVPAACEAQIVLQGNVQIQGNVTLGASNIPQAVSLLPVSGMPGTPITITGVNFGAAQGTSKVYFNGHDAGTATSWGPAQIDVNVPSGATTGPVVVTVGGVSSNALTFSVTGTASPPAINGLSPIAGPVGTSVTINGANFGGSQGTGKVYFNGQDAGAATGWNATTITAAVPSGATSGLVVVTVGNVASNGLSFTVSSGSGAPLITSVTPGAGSPGTIVTIGGVNFGTTQGTSKVYFNGLDAGMAPSWNATTIMLPVPNGAASGYLTVQVSGQISNAVYFVVNPVINALSLKEGPTQMGFVITGTGFGSSQGSSYVTLSGTQMPVVNGLNGQPLWTEQSITVQVPLAASIGPATIVVNEGLAHANWSFTVDSPFGCTP